MKCFRLIGGIVLDGGNVRNAFFATFFPTFPSFDSFEDSNPTNPKFGLRFFFPFHSRSSVSIRSYVRSSDSPSRQSVCLAIHLSVYPKSLGRQMWRTPNCALLVWGWFGIVFHHAILFQMRPRISTRGCERNAKFCWRDFIISDLFYYLLSFIM